MENTSIYDSVPYPFFTFPQTNPSRLAVMASYSGMSPASPEKCRVLELGCANGANLLSFAYIFPESEFVGIDLSAVQIEQANKAASELGIENIKFKQKDLLGFDLANPGKFDFIIAHGLYSWVPPNVRDRALEIFRECLGPQGVGYISYNAYPGSHFRDMAINAMKFHTGRSPASIEQVYEGIKFLAFLKEIAKSLGAYSQVIEREYSEMLERRPENIFHDELCEVNQPFYFYEFAENLKRFGLQYISECYPGDHAANVSAETEGIISSLADDEIRREQYLDFISCRRFRSTLICRDDVELNRRGNPDVIKTSRLSSRLNPVSEQPDLSTGVVERFAGPGQYMVEVEDPLTKAALVYLSRIWVASASYDQTIENARDILGISAGKITQEDTEKMAAFFLKQFESDALMLDRFEARFSQNAGERPMASRFARWQISRGASHVTTLTGMNIDLDNDLARLVTLLLDGSRDRSMIYEELLSRIRMPDEKRAEFEADLPTMVEEVLSRLAKCGVLEQGDPDLSAASIQ